MKKVFSTNASIIHTFLLWFRDEMAEIAKNMWNKYR